MKFNPAAMFYCVSALKHFEDLSEKEIRDIGFEIAFIGQNGIDTNNPDSKYYVKSLSKELSGLQAVSYMYVAWKQINSSMDVGVDFQEEYLSAKRLIEKEKPQIETLEDNTVSYILSFSELNVNSTMSDEEILIKVVAFGGIETPKAVSIDVMRDAKIVLVQTTEFMVGLSSIDDELFQQAIKDAEKGNVQLALKKLKKLLTKYPNNAQILENIGRCYLEIQEWNDAKIYYLRALEYKKTTNSYIGIANAYKRLGNVNEAIKCYEEAIVLNPEYALSYNNLAVVMIGVERLKDAEKYFLKALNLDPDNPQTLYGIGLMYKKIGEIEKAKSYFEKAEINSDKAPNLKRIISDTIYEMKYGDVTNSLNINKQSISNNIIPELCDDLKAILKKAEIISGKGFQFIEKEDLTEHAGIKIARKDDEKHLIYFKKEHIDLLQHFIAHECGHVIRIFSANENDRVVPASTNATKEIAYKEMEDDIIRLSNEFSERKLSTIMNMWYNGVIRQVTNQPVDYLIEKWIYDEYPNLRTYQLKSLQQQAKESIAGLSPELRKMTPRKIYYASNLMNYAYLRLVGFHIKYNFIKPYGGTEFLVLGKALAERTKKDQEDNFLGDIKMINIWAGTISISQWFEWVDFEKNK